MKKRKFVRNQNIDDFDKSRIFLPKLYFTTT